MIERPFRITMWAIYNLLASLFAAGWSCIAAVYDAPLYERIVFFFAGMIIAMCCLAIAFGLYCGQPYAWKFFAAMPWVDGQYFHSEEVRTFFNIETKPTPK
jgi:Ni,Fe-hydrogenase I cytochrome b subunit